MSLPPILTTTDDVNDFARELEQFPVIAVDLEADSMHCYQEKVCLLQFTTPERTVLIDPLLATDLSALKPVLASSDVRKIFHAADYDIRCLARDFDIQINGLFDTMISCQFLGEEKFGLADILNKYYGLELDKKYQRADWSLRPLTEGMIRYAAADTSHLHQLAEELEQQLLEKKRLHWVLEEFTLLEQARFATHEGAMFLRFKGAGRLDSSQLAVLEELLCWRDQEARRRDCPHYKVLGNKSLLQLAVTKPRGQKGLVGIEGISPRLVDRYGKQILQAIGAGLNWSEDKLPCYPRGKRRLKDPAADQRMVSLKKWRTQVSAELALEPGVLINNAMLEDLSQVNPASRDELKQSSILKNWQLEELGDGILAALKSG